MKKTDAVRKVIVKVVGYGQIKAESGSAMKVLRSAGFDAKAFDLKPGKTTKTARYYQATPKGEIDVDRTYVASIPVADFPGVGAHLCPTCNGYYIADACPNCSRKEESPEFAQDLDPRSSILTGEPESSNLTFTDLATGSEVQAPKKIKKAPWVDVETKVQRLIFTQALDFALQVAGKSPEILAHVALIVEPERITIQATDLEVSFQTVMTASGGTVKRCIPAGLLLSEVKALPENVTEVALTFKEYAVSVNARADIVTGDACDFPELGLPETLDGKELVFIDGLIAGLKQVLPAVSTDPARFVLNGILVNCKDKKMVATDGFRLHVADITANRDFDRSFILTAKAAKILIKQGGPQSVLIDEEGKYISIPVLGGVFRARLLDGMFPDYKSIWPDPDHTVTFSSKEFSDMVLGAKILADNDQVELAIAEELTLKAASSLGFYEWHLPCSVKGATVGENGGYQLFFNLKFLLDAMKSYPNETVTIRFPKTYGAVLVNTGAVVMPIRR